MQTFLMLLAYCFIASFSAVLSKPKKDLMSRLAVCSKHVQSSFSGCTCGGGWKCVMDTETSCYSTCYFTYVTTSTKAEIKYLIINQKTCITDEVTLCTEVITRSRNNIAGGGYVVEMFQPVRYYWSESHYIDFKDSTCWHKCLAHLAHYKRII